VNRAVFVDRDGVINEFVPGSEGPDSPRSVEEFRLLPGVADAIRRLNSLGLPIVLVSNQPGVAKGKYPMANLDAMTNQLKASLAENDASLQGIYYCLHHPEATVAEYRQLCDCRKPKSGLLTRAARDMNLALVDSYMVGDQPRDMIAGKSVGCTTVLVAPQGLAAVPREADHVCSDLAAAAQLIAQLEAMSPASL
jgi:D-glycero-D-manno-heptose 1,7-bisphosphate phosphatase